MSQSEVPAAIRAVTGTEFDYNGDWLALADQLSIPAGTFNERQLLTIDALGNGTRPELAALHATVQGFMPWVGAATIPPNAILWKGQILTWRGETLVY